MKRYIDDIDKWAEQTGKHCYGGKPLSSKRITASTRDYDRVWRKLWKEEKQKTVQL